VRVLHPGFGSVEGGPDFRGAVLQIGDAPPRSGDVEVDLRASGWHAHGHDRNPAFHNVILHVVWDHERATNRTPLVLPLRNSLDAPVGELSLWLDCEPVKSLPEKLLGQCSAPLRDLSEAQLKELLREAARVRFQSKAAQFVARARHAGWEQALWEGLFRALGYKHNAWPMHCLAEMRSRWTRSADSILALQARLLGISGLLPAELNRSPAGGGYLRHVWDFWWRERDEFEDCALPRTLWRFHGLRPANHPQRRLALATHWLASGDLGTKLEQWCAADAPEGARVDSLWQALQAGRDDYWSWHWTLRSPRLTKPQPMLGAARVTDLAVNVILPWLWARAAEGGTTRLQQEIERRYFAWPAAGDNAVLRLARQRLLAAAPRRVLRGAAAQQGLMQIVRDFCEHSSAICESCRFPELVREWRARDGATPACLQVWQ
jgi:hypothetical protein